MDRGLGRRRFNVSNSIHMLKAYSSLPNQLTGPGWTASVGPNEKFRLSVDCSEWPSLIQLQRQVTGHPLEIRVDQCGWGREW